MKLNKSNLLQSAFIIYLLSSAAMIIYQEIKLYDLYQLVYECKSSYLDSSSKLNSHEVKISNLEFHVDKLIIDYNDNKVN